MLRYPCKIRNHIQALIKSRNRIPADDDDDGVHLELDVVAEQVEEVVEVGAAALVGEQLVVHDLPHPDHF